MLVLALLLRTQGIAHTQLLQLYWHTCCCSCNLQELLAGCLAAVPAAVSPATAPQQPQLLPQVQWQQCLAARQLRCAPVGNKSMLLLMLLRLCIHRLLLDVLVQQALLMLLLVALPSQQVHALQAALAAAAAGVKCKLCSCTADHILLLLLSQLASHSC
jgi:hypothetical protein